MRCLISLLSPFFSYCIALRFAKEKQNLLIYFQWSYIAGERERETLWVVLWGVSEGSFTCSAASFLSPLLPFHFLRIIAEREKEMLTISYNSTLSSYVILSFTVNDAVKVQNREYALLRIRCLYVRRILWTLQDWTAQSYFCWPRRDVCSTLLAGQGWAYFW